MNDVLEKVKTKTKSGKVFEILIVVILALVVAVIVITSFRDNEEPDNVSEEYVRQMERRLASVLSSMEGVGAVEIFMTVSSEGKTVIAKESVVGEDGSVTTKPVFSGGDPIVLEECKPEITGVLIVADGADDLTVRFNLLEATASVLNINQSIIKVYTKSDSD